MTDWLTIAGMAAVTYFLRAVALVAPWPMAPRASVGLRFAPVAILASLIAPAMLAPRGRIEAGPDLWASLFGAFVAARTGSVLFTLLAGFAARAVFFAALGAR